MDRNNHTHALRPEGRPAKTRRVSVAFAEPMPGLNPLQALREHPGHVDTMIDLSRTNGIPGQVDHWTREKTDLLQVLTYEESRMPMNPHGYDLKPFAVVPHGNPPRTLIVAGRHFDWRWIPIREVGRDANGRAITASVRLPDPAKLAQTSLMVETSSSRMDAIQEEIRRLRFAVSQDCSSQERLREYRSRQICLESEIRSLKARLGEQDTFNALVSQKLGSLDQSLAALDACLTSLDAVLHKLGSEEVSHGSQ